jgi:hypothetical protein
MKDAQSAVSKAAEMAARRADPKEWLWDAMMDVP